MRKIISAILLVIIAGGITLSIMEIPFGVNKAKVGEYYINHGREETGAINIVTSVVLNYRGFDTLGEVTILFLAALSVGAALSFSKKKNDKKEKLEPASLILYTGCRFLFPILLLVGSYIFIHGHLTPGGGFQGGAIIASAYLLIYLSFHGKRINEKYSKLIESLSGLIFIALGLIGLVIGGGFLFNYLPKGTLGTLFSAGIIPIIYIAIGLKVGSELTGIINNLIEES